MKRSSRCATAAVFAIAAALTTSCATASRQPTETTPPDSGATASAESGATVVRPGAPGQASRTVDAGGTVPDRAAYSAADVSFMQGMIAHHAQALVMTGMVGERTERDGIRLLARRIADSQKSEMDMMRSWLRARDEAVAGAHAQHGAMHMPGMLTTEELDSLRATRGVEFDRTFIDLMIRHHEGALTMVADLFAAGGGEDPEIFQFASHVDADQRAEIDRMRRLRTALLQRGSE